MPVRMFISCAFQVDVILHLTYCTTVTKVRGCKFSLAFYPNEMTIHEGTCVIPCKRALIFYMWKYARVGYEVPIPEFCSALVLLNFSINYKKIMIRSIHFFFSKCGAHLFQTELFTIAYLVLKRKSYPSWISKVEENRKSRK